jgi:hypothetical protein
LRDVLRKGTSDLTAEASIAFARELRHGLGERRLNPRADVNQVLVDGVVDVHASVLRLALVRPEPRLHWDALPLRLHDVDDGVRFAGAIANRSRLELSYHDAEDLRQYLVTELWLLSTRYDPAVSSISFSTWAGTTLRLRVVDWQRQRFGRTKWSFAGRTYERPRPNLVPLDARLDDALGAGAGDPADGGDLGLARVLDGGDRQRLRDLETLGLDPPRGTAG